MYGRDARTGGPRSLKHLFSGQYYRTPEANRLSGVYELLLRRASEAGSPGLSPASLVPSLKNQYNLCNTPQIFKIFKNACAYFRKKSTTFLSIISRLNTNLHYCLCTHRYH